jgi:Flp pilus assembly protein TadD
VWLFISPVTIPSLLQRFRINLYPKEVVSEPNTAAEELCQRAMDHLAAGDAAGAIESFRSAVAADPNYFEAHHGLIRALRDAGRLEPSIAAALALTALTPDDPLAHTALSISLQLAGHIPEAEAAAARARVLEWKAQLRSPFSGNTP